MFIFNSHNSTANKPFLKWAGGKRQLIEQIVKRFPTKTINSRYINKYLEPFVGGGAVFLFVNDSFIIDSALLCDVNKELILAYKVVKRDPIILIRKLQILEKEYLGFSSEIRKDYFYKVRSQYNQQMLSINYCEYSSTWVDRASLLLFLNKTCFNGLFRQNKKGEFNVPHGRYKNPTICNEKDILSASNALQGVNIVQGDFEETEYFVDENTLVYLDPPYKPLNRTSSFTGYSKGGFDDSDQIRLSEYIHRLNNKGAKVILSNSDPKNVDPNDEYFDDLYREFVIERVSAKRAINRDASKRGSINEIIVRNY